MEIWPVDAGKHMRTLDFFGDHSYAYTPAANYKGMGLVEPFDGHVVSITQRVRVWPDPLMGAQRPSPRRGMGLR